MAGKHLSKIPLTVSCLTLLTLLGCGSDLFYPNPAYGGGSTTAVFYTVDATDNTILELQGNGTAAPSTLAALSLPSGFNASVLATDPAGHLYVGGYTTNVNASEVLVYAAAANGSATPLRTVNLQTGQITALAADSSGQIYAAQVSTAALLNVYAAAANGASAPTRSIAQSNFLYINDVAVDTSGNVYICAYNGGVYLVSVFSSTATGAATPQRTITAGVGSYFGGIAVDSTGDLYVMEQLTIVEFAPGASGTPLPINSINLPSPTAPFTTEAYSNVLRLDSAGNLNVPTTKGNAFSSANVVFVFSPTETGNATPLVQFTPTGATTSTPLGINIPLAVR